MEKKLSFDIRKLNDIYSDYTPDLNRIGHSFSPEKRAEEERFKVSTTELREFIDETFDIPMTIYNPNNRNRLNLLVKQVAKTSQGKRTFLNQKQFIDLITKTEFINFIVKEFDQEYVIDSAFPNRLKELTYLQQNKLIMEGYLTNSTENITANYLTFFPSLVKEIKNLYIGKIEGDLMSEKGELAITDFGIKILNRVIENERTLNTTIEQIENERDQATMIRFLQDIKISIKKVRAADDSF